MNHPASTMRSAATDGQGLALVVVGVGVCSVLHVGTLSLANPHLQAELALNLVQAGFLLSLVQLAGLSLGAACRPAGRPAGAAARDARR